LTRHSYLLLFDEPFSALDTPRRRRLQRSLRELQREISAVTIIVTHDPDDAALLADNESAYMPMSSP
jgi:ABC-type proline/glycine betaine transport system ATPase subunit